MKSSTYITWAKSKHGIEYNLGRSGVPRPDLLKLIKNPADILASGEHEDGWPPLLEQIAVRYGVESNQIVLAHGASMANHLVCATLLEPGDEVLVENPVYDPLRILPEYFHSTVKSFSRPPERGYQPDPEEIASLVNSRTRLIILSDLHNPSGTLLDRGVLNEIIRIAENHSFHILIDEVYLEFLYPEGERTSALSSHAVITTRSLTKAFGLDDLRIGWIIAAQEITDRIRQIKNLFSITTAFPSERLATHAFEEADILLENTMSLLRRNFVLLDSFIEANSHLDWQRPAAGSVGFVRMKEKSVDDFVNFLEARFGTIVTPGRFFGLPEYFRIGWGMPEDQFDEALGRFKEGLKIFYE